MGLTGEALFADSAVLIPELLEGLPFRFLPPVPLMRLYMLWNQVFHQKQLRIRNYLVTKR